MTTATGQRSRPAYAAIVVLGRDRGLEKICAHYRYEQIRRRKKTVKIFKGLSSHQGALGRWRWSPDSDRAPILVWLCGQHLRPDAGGCSGRFVDLVWVGCCGVVAIEDFLDVSEGPQSD
jgi:hypothetical protein